MKKQYKNEKVEKNGFKKRKLNISKKIKERLQATKEYLKIINF